MNDPLANRCPSQQEEDAHGRIGRYAANVENTMVGVDPAPGAHAAGFEFPPHPTSKPRAAVPDERFEATNHHLRPIGGNACPLDNLASIPAAALERPLAERLSSIWSPSMNLSFFGRIDSLEAAFYHAFEGVIRQYLHDEGHFNAAWRDCMLKVDVL